MFIRYMSHEIRFAYWIQVQFKWTIHMIKWTIAFMEGPLWISFTLAWTSSVRICAPWRKGLHSLSSVQRMPRWSSRYSLRARQPSKSWTIFCNTSTLIQADRSFVIGETPCLFFTHCYSLLQSQVLHSRARVASGCKFPRRQARLDKNASLAQPCGSHHWRRHHCFRGRYSYLAHDLVFLNEYKLLYFFKRKMLRQAEIFKVFPLWKTYSWISTFTKWNKLFEIWSLMRY